MNLVFKFKGEKLGFDPLKILPGHGESVGRDRGDLRDGGGCRRDGARGAAPEADQRAMGSRRRGVEGTRGAVRHAQRKAEGGCQRDDEGDARWARVRGWEHAQDAH